MAAWELLVAGVAGGVLGLLITLLGGGGTLLLFPILVYVFHLSTATAAGTSLMAVLGAAVVGLAGHWRGGRVNGAVALLFGSAAVAGSVAGTHLHTYVSDQLTTTIFAVVLFVTAARMFIQRRGGPTKLRPGTVNWKVLLPLGLATGLLSGFLGVGGGFLIVPGLMMGAHLAIHEAIGTSVAVIAMSTISGAIAHLVHGSVHGPLALTIGVGALIGSVAAIPIASKVPARPLRITFALVVLFAALGVTAQVVIAAF